MLAKRGQNLNSVVNFEIPDAVLIPRIGGRLVHASSGRSYHKLFNPPKTPMKDDVTGEALMQRADDTEETAAVRLTAFHKQTQVRAHTRARDRAALFVACFARCQRRNGAD